MEPSELLRHLADTCERLGIPYRELLYFLLGGSEKYLGDIVGVFKLHAEKLDRTYIADWANQPHVENEWRLVLSRLTNV